MMMVKYNYAKIVNYCVYIRNYTGVIVYFLPTMITVNEFDGFAQVCAILSTRSPTERKFMINFSTSNGSGKTSIVKNGAREPITCF